MVVEILVLCDNAQNYNQKLVIVGTFNAINTQSLPCRYTFSLACRFSFDKEDIPWKKQIKIELKDNKGNVLIPAIQALIDIPEIKEDIHTTNLVIGFGNITFNSFGKYMVQVTFGEFYRELPIYIRELPKIKDIFDKIPEL